MTTPEQFERDLQQQYQHEKARHAAPPQLSERIMQRAKPPVSQRWWPAWRNMQLALSSAFVLVLGYLLLLQQPSSPLYYQIVVTSDSQYREVQQHRITVQKEQALAMLPGDASNAYQQYVETAQRNDAFHTQTGLLRQNAEQWQISVCNDLLLKVDRQLLAQLNVVPTPDDFQLQQWVEFVSNDAGQLVAIRPTSTVLQCPQA